MPRAPLGVTATIELTDKITVSWEAVAGATSYSVYGNNTPSTAGATLLAAGVAGTSYDDAVTAEESFKFYFVKAVTGAGTSGFSGIATGWREMAAPETPVLDGLPEPGASYLTWEAVDRALFYEIWRDGFFLVKIAADAITTFEYEDFDITPHTSYDYVVYAGNFTDKSDASNTVTIEPADPVPGSVLGVAATDGTHPSKVVITWPAVDYAATYNLYRSLTALNPAPTLIASGIAGTSYDDIVASGTTYYYKLKAVGESGTSPFFGNEDSGYAMVLPASTGVSATDDGYDEVTVTWSAVTGADLYNVYKDGSLYASGTPALVLHDTLAAIGSAHSYQVQARNSVTGESSALSSADNGTRLQIPDPTSVAASDNRLTDVLITWTPEPLASNGYEIFRDGSLLTSLSTQASSSFTDDSVSDCTIYNYVVVSVRGSNQSAGFNNDNGHKRPTGDLCTLGGGNSTTTSEDANDSYVFCGNPTISWHFNAYAVADTFQLYLDGLLVVDLSSVTGEHSGSFGVGGDSGVHTILVIITHGTGSTEWAYDLSC